jgi:hypothetical protein
MTPHAAALTYYGLMSLFPEALLGLSLLGLVGQYPETYNAIINPDHRVLDDGGEAARSRRPARRLPASSGQISPGTQGWDRLGRGWRAVAGRPFGAGPARSRRTSGGEVTQYPGMRMPTDHAGAPAHEVPPPHAMFGARIPGRPVGPAAGPH